MQNINIVKIKRSKPLKSEQVHHGNGEQVANNRLANKKALKQQRKQQRQNKSINYSLAL